MDRELLVQNIERYCSKKGVKPTNACRDSGVGASFLTDIKRGQTPSVAKVQLLAQYLGCTVSDLLGEAPGALPAVPEGPTEQFLKLFLSLDDKAQNEIVAGSNGRFRPADHVTLRELAKMLLVLLGEDSARYVGAGWAQNVDQDAFEKGIYAGLTAGYEEDATRDNACLLIYNATLCPKVANASENSVQRYVLDALMNPMSYLEIRFGLPRYTATLTGNECADLTGSSPLPAGTSKLAGHKAFQVSTDLSLLGRSVDIYVKDGKVFGVPCYAVDEIYYTFADASQLKEICQGGGFRLTDETEYYYNYARSSKDILNTLSENDKITVIDHDGDNAFDVVLVTTSRPATVTATSPLTVDVGGQSYEVQAFSQADTFAVGDAVYYSQVCGSGYIRWLNG